MRWARFLCLVAVAMILAGAAPMATSSALAQPPDDAKADKLRERVSRRRSQHAPLNINRLVEAVEEQLDASAEQLEEIRELADEYRRRLQEERAERQATLAEQREMMRELFEEKMEARRAHDREREQEIQRQIEELRPKNRRRQLEEEFIKAVGEILDDEQRKQFRTIVERMRNPALDPERLRTNPSLLRTAISRLELDQDQRAEIDELWTGYWQEMRDLDPADRDARKQLAAEFYEQVTQILTEEQVEQLKSNPLGRRARRPKPPAVAPGQAGEHDDDQDDEHDDDDDDDNDDEDDDHDEEDDD